MWKQIAQLHPVIYIIFIVAIVVSIIQSLRAKHFRELAKAVTPEAYKMLVDEKVDLKERELLLTIQQHYPKELAKQFTEMFNKRVLVLRKDQKFFKEYHTELMLFSIYIYEISEKDKRDEMFQRLIPKSFKKFRSDYKDYGD